MSEKELNWPELWQELGNVISEKPDHLELARLQSARENDWFTLEHIDFALHAIQKNYLQKELVGRWMEAYPDAPSVSPVRIGLVCAGNIPMVGWHDIQCILTSGHHAVIKLSHKDKFLIPAFLKELTRIQPKVADRFTIVDKLQNYEAVIATGSNNSLRYFNSYFSHVPHIFRHNRTSVGILQPEDSVETLKGIASDIFLHFGLGCRNISKLFIPKAFDLDGIFSATQSYSSYGLHSKYRNNFIYHTALFQMNKVPYFTNDLLILLETEEWHSPLSVIYYERYDDIADVKNEITARQDEIQVVYAGSPIRGLSTVTPGTGQTPQLADYADHVDTMAWLNQLNNR